MPTWPSALLPQHFTPPPAISTHAWPRLPVCSACSVPAVSPVPSTGVPRCTVVPSPTWPTWFPPQHLTLPSVLSAQLLSSMSAAALTPVLSPVTTIGFGLLANVLSPSCPLQFAP